MQAISNTTRVVHGIHVPRRFVALVVVAVLAATAALAIVLASSRDEVSNKASLATPTQVAPSGPANAAQNDGTQHSGARP